MELTAATMQGVIISYKPDGGFGWIQYGGDSDAFFHVSEFEGSRPTPGDKVQFVLVDSRKGKRALLVKRIG